MRKPPKDVEERRLKHWIMFSAKWHHLYAEDAWIYHDLYISPQNRHGRVSPASPPPS